MSTGQKSADALARNLTTITLCPYMARYLERRPIEGGGFEWPNRAPRLAPRHGC